MLRRVGEGEDILTCPYDPSHQIMRCRFQVHLVRCRKSFPNAEMVVCPFDVTHRINEKELDVSCTLLHMIEFMCPKGYSTNVSTITELSYRNY